VDRRVVAVDLTRGRLKWAYRMDGPSLSGVLFRRDTLIAGAERPGGEVVALADSSGRRAWKRRVGYVSAPLALVGDVVIVQTRTKGTYGLNVNDGRVLWRTPLMGGRVSAVPGGEGTILFGTLDSLYRVEAATGKVLVRLAAPGTFACDWVPSPRGIVAATGEGEILLLDPATLRPTWRRKLDGAVLVAPLVLGDSIYVATQPNSVWRVSLDDGTATKVFQHPFPITAPIGAWDGALLVGDAKGILTAYEPSGEVRWRIGVGRPVEMAPMEFEGDLVVFGGRGDIHRYSK
jgi:outer membrane protein assembly factor BamB